MSIYFFFGTLLVSLISLFIANWRAIAPERASQAVRFLGACSGALGLMIPVFYLLYLGLIPRATYHIAIEILNASLPILWAHLAVSSWSRGRTALTRFGPALALVATVPALFFVVWAGATPGVRYLLLIIDWTLLLVSLALWRRANSEAQAAASP